MLADIAEQPEVKLDAPKDVQEAKRKARQLLKGGLAKVKRDTESGTKLVADRVDRHAKLQLGQVLKGIKLSESAPEVAKLVPRWRRENVELITNMLDEQLDKVEAILEAGSGLRVETLAKELRRQLVDVSASRAELIARDQVLTLNAQINTARMRDAEIEEAYWTTSGDEAVRDSHREMDGVLFRLDDPPIVDGEAVLPGEPIQCRCIAFPRVPEFD